jgi:hypothetical protein
MTNDNTPIKPIEETFRLAVLETVALCMERGLAPYKIPPILEKIAADLREDERKVAADSMLAAKADEGKSDDQPL